MTGLNCRRCGKTLAAELATLGVHVVCCDPACDRWPCDGTHRPGQPSTGSLSDFAFYPARVAETGGWCGSCSAPVDVPGGVCSPICLARLARKHAPEDYQHRKRRP